jgi:hypothetical protein
MYTFYLTPENCVILAAKKGRQNTTISTLFPLTGKKDDILVLPNKKRHNTFKKEGCVFLDKFSSKEEFIRKYPEYSL